MQLFIEIIKALIIGIIEGLTEWLPISSTGHMIIVNEFVQLDVSPAFLALFLVVIQLGAILAVLLLYFQRLNPFSKKKTVKEQRTVLRLWLKVVVGCLPAAVIGLLFDDWVEEHFFNAFVVAVALIVYGIAFIVVERLQQAHEKPRPLRRSRYDQRDQDELDQLTWTQVLVIGCCQCLAIVPGTSRSGSTILGARILGVSRQAAAEYSFFLAIPVMFGWSLLKAIKTLMLDQLVVTANEWIILLVGVLVAFLVSVVAIRFLMGFIQKHDFQAFGWYRIALGLLVIVYFLISGGLFS
ncbi:MAG: undecaprenyl-diphosphate phosphatase [Coriobacteriales bacterium]|jgi:undecaprenyl-diphosphatase|nr:undecaprenyl-diphosphate phosphatase [Coriobacteriales bacterium]